MSSETGDLEAIKQTMKQPVLIDLRNVYRPEEIEGFTYHGIGRPNPTA